MPRVGQPDVPDRERWVLHYRCSSCESNITLLLYQVDGRNCGHCGAPLKREHVTDDMFLFRPQR